MLTFISLFSGIGGLDLGLERAGLRCVAQVEIDAYCRQVLAKHWPTVPRYGDIATCGAHNLPPADCLAGGFPCQDISNAGKKAGLQGAQSGLWREYARLIGELRPKYVLVENVRALCARGLDTVCGDLAGLGYDAEWAVISACAFGAPHTRERLFLVAYPAGLRRTPGSGYPHALERPPGAGSLAAARASWPDTSDLGRTPHGLPQRMDRVKGLGNAVVPAVGEYLGQCLLALDSAVKLGYN